ncbi:hypothetical protein [Rhizobium sullae]|uniref:hypothetical protein n=1 Tax=Rhizobium sullae TaxID=50338 RepID=UPI0010481595|nr:hypothetical protein [Rhizobium sullae]
MKHIASPDSAIPDATIAITVSRRCGVRSQDIIEVLISLRALNATSRSGSVFAPVQTSRIIPVARVCGLDIAAACDRLQELRSHLRLHGQIFKQQRGLIDDPTIGAGRHITEVAQQFCELYDLVPLPDGSFQQFLGGDCRLPALGCSNA